MVKSPMIMHSCAQQKKSANTVKHPDPHLFQLSTPLKKKQKTFVVSKSHGIRQSQTELIALNHRRSLKGLWPP